MAYLETISVSGRGRERGGAVSKRSHIIKQSYYVSEYDLIWGGGQGRALREINF